MNLCNTYVVENTLRGEQVMILDPGAPMSLVGRPWIEEYLAEFDYMIKDMVSSKCYQVFRFGGIDKRHVSTLMIQLPLILRNTLGREELISAQVYVIDGDVAFLCGTKTLEQWGSNLNMKKSILETCKENVQIDCRMIKMDAGHYGVKLETQNKKGT